MYYFLYVYTTIREDDLVVVVVVVIQVFLYRILLTVQLNKLCRFVKIKQYSQWKNAKDWSDVYGMH